MPGGFSPIAPSGSSARRLRSSRVTGELRAVPNPCYPRHDHGPGRPRVHFDERIGQCVAGYEDAGGL
ncbi:MAG TPA: hypothetical protein VHX38_07825, partial [Pseudonocardiaceae bacterium]|nr:hypothetical protein [Pseudonocardiaceae bacterium]